MKTTKEEILVENTDKKLKKVIKLEIALAQKTK